MKAVEIQSRDDRAPEYDDWVCRMRGSYSCEAELRAVMRALRITSRSRVLDAGCGTGRLTMLLAARAESVSAVDFSPRSVDVLRRRLAEERLSNVQTMVGDLNHVSLVAESFDAVASVGVMHHIPTHELRCDALARLRAALKIGGRLVVVVYRWGGMIDSRKERKEGVHGSGVYYHAFSPTDLRELLREAGFRGIRVRGLISCPGRIRRHLPAAASVLEPFLMVVPWSALVSDFLIASAIK